MLRLTVKTEEYLMINDNIKIVFLGGTPNHLRIMIDAPKDVNIVRSSVLENQATPEEREKLPKYYAEEEHPEKYKKKKVVIANGNTKGQNPKNKYGQVIHTNK
ncbi:MAG: carbon storage regulator [Lachnospiraceae bacterium]|nr:carbon storage regulator [Lachnospiraceae bacterium]